ncbi:MAG: hypothetical protein JWQ90_2624 [Hydrocarboniphaga sp.]|uniref:hypothetical protein n=1 Tax=Hydrocarboniphaga sp. TaxID=2033016 RepID=UPI00260ECFC2|nr:hypothetical protein [Hydrocarboniphaga sp.]MDB5970174.1 hypothetical protein [Hydrocarboniphaga sp.]
MIRFDFPGKQVFVTGGGGIGMTNARVAGCYLKYARVAEMLHGKAAAMANRYARLRSF